MGYLKKEIDRIKPSDYEALYNKLDNVNSKITNVAKKCLKKNGNNLCETINNLKPFINNSLKVLASGTNAPLEKIKFRSKKEESFCGETVGFRANIDIPFKICFYDAYINGETITKAFVNSNEGLYQVEIKDTIHKNNSNINYIRSDSRLESYIYYEFIEADWGWNGTVYGEGWHDSPVSESHKIRYNSGELGGLIIQTKTRYNSEYETTYIRNRPYSILKDTDSEFWISGELSSAHKETLKYSKKIRYREAITSLHSNNSTGILLENNYGFWDVSDSGSWSDITKIKKDSRIDFSVYSLEFVMHQNQPSDNTWSLRQNTSNYLIDKLKFIPCEILGYFYDYHKNITTEGQITQLDQGNKILRWVILG